MPLLKKEQNNRRLAAVIGFWSALLMAITNLWFYVAFLPYSPVWSAPWPGMAAYAASFQSKPFLKWVIPSFLLPSVVLVMMISVNKWAAKERQPWSLLAVAFATLYAAVLTPFYYIQMTVVPYHLIQGTTEGLSLWLFAYHYPYNIFGAFEGIGYGLLGVSLFFAAHVFRSGRLQQWVRWTFIGLGASVFALFINPLFPLPNALGLGAGLAGLILGVLAPVLLACVFRRDIIPSSKMDIQT
jgi:hypothetical protein